MRYRPLAAASCSLRGNQSLDRVMVYQPDGGAFDIDERVDVTARGHAGGAHLQRAPTRALARQSCGAFVVLWPRSNVWRRSFPSCLTSTPGRQISDRPAALPRGMWLKRDVCVGYRSQNTPPAVGFLMPMLPMMYHIMYHMGPGRLSAAMFTIHGLDSCVMSASTRTVPRNGCRRRHGTVSLTSAKCSTPQNHSPCSLNFCSTYACHVAHRHARAERGPPARAFVGLLPCIHA